MMKQKNEEGENFKKRKIKRKNEKIGKLKKEGEVEK